MPKKKPTPNHDYRSTLVEDDGTVTITCDQCPDKWTENHPTAEQAEQAWRKHRGE